MALTPGSWPHPLLRVIRTSNKYLLNPVVRRFAGRKQSYAAVIRHTGRKSGRPYSTPVGSDRVDGGFVVPLAYGERVDWLQNVLAAGRATMTVDGAAHDVTEPVVVDAAAVLPLLSPQRRRRYERLGIERFLRVKIA